MIKTGDRVITIECESRNGVVKKIFAEVTPPVAIVEFEDGNIEKVAIEKIALEPKTENGDNPEKAQTKTKSEPVEKSEITITPDEFKQLASSIVAEEIEKTGKSGESLGLTYTIFVAKLHKALFFDEVDNLEVMTQSEHIREQLRRGGG